MAERNGKVAVPGKEKKGWKGGTLLLEEEAGGPRCQDSTQPLSTKVYNHFQLYLSTLGTYLVKTVRNAPIILGSGAELKLLILGPIIFYFSLLILITATASAASFNHINHIISHYHHSVQDTYVRYLVNRTLRIL